MDAKSRALVMDTLLRIDSGTFTEGDVSALWLALREHVAKYPLVREFGDFVAHRERDKGRIYNHVSTLIDQFKDYPNTTVEVKEAFREADLLRGTFKCTADARTSSPTRPRAPNDGCSDLLHDPIRSGKESKQAG